MISFVPAFLVTWYGAKFGYELGNEYLKEIQGKTMDRVMYAFGIVGLMAVGAMAATLIGVTTPATFADGTLVLQDVLDSVCPQLLSLGSAMLMYWLLKKHVNSGWLLVICIAGGVLLSALGIAA